MVTKWAKGCRGTPGRGSPVAGSMNPGIGKDKKAWDDGGGMVILVSLV